MPRPPSVHILPSNFYADPYPDLAVMRRKTPICHVPKLGAVLFTKRDDIFECEKNIEVFSSVQPEGLMTKLMGQNMMRKDGVEHLAEKKQIFPSVSPKTVRDFWKQEFTQYAEQTLEKLLAKRSANLVTDYAMPISGDALRVITGLTNTNAADIDRCSQHMIDGCANYTGDAEIEQKCHAATQFLDEAIDQMAPAARQKPDMSILSVLQAADQPMQSIKANIKLAISGGQNEPRDAIAGTTWALLTHPGQLDKILDEDADATWLQAFEEYARWISPIGMSPRQIAQDFTWKDIDFKLGERVFFMFGSGNRDEDIFNEPDAFDITRNNSKSISFGAGPHFCAGASASRCLIAEVALPMLFAACPDLHLTGETPFAGWAFRGPTQVPVGWSG